MTNTSTSGSPQNRRKADITRRQFLQGISGMTLLAAILLNAVALAMLWRWWGTSATLAAQTPEPLASVQMVELPPVYTPQPVPTPSLAPNPTPTLVATQAPNDVRPRVGIIAGHWQNDSGAVCEDTGLQEVHVTLAVAEMVVKNLKHRGFQTELLAEFDPALTDYRAITLVSIHADSCLNWQGLTGFKIARSKQSMIPEVEDALVACLYKEYERASRLPRHDASITPNMTEYHAFRTINPHTPAAIIELGFLYNDRDSLTRPRSQARLADGITDGITCFLEQQNPQMPSPPD